MCKMLILPHNYVQLQHSAICQETNHVYASIGKSRDERKLCHCRTLEDSPLSIFFLVSFCYRTASSPDVICKFLRNDLVRPNR